MTQAGYSGTPLPQKLGIRAGHAIALLHAPPGFDRTLGALPEGVRVQRSLRGTRPLDVIVLFADRAATLARRFPQAAARLGQSGGLWVSWPKKASGVKTDVGEALVRETGLGHGRVDNKICAVDGTWSGLRFVVRVKDRRR